MVLTDNEYVFENNHEVKVKHGRKSKLGMVMSLIWNPKTREFCGRDGVGWFRLSVFYAAFYFCLASFFIGMLAVFMQIMPTDRPTYYGDDSIMNARGCPLNPGMGFRPQIDVEDSLIMYDPSVGNDDELAKGYKRQTRNLKIFLESKYGELTGDLKELEVDCKANKSYDGHGKFCKFNPSELFASTDCTEAKEFGYNTTRPCVLLKLNKIYSWKPQAALGYITVNCSGETSVDQDNLKNVIYHSEGLLNNPTEGRIDAKYYPFTSQRGYRAPFIWVQPEVTPNMLVNIECSAYAENIDRDRVDSVNRRGSTKFSLYISSIANKNNNNNKQ